MADNFKDLFSAQSEGYAKYRPHYPPALFSYLAELAPSRDLAWDCGTGNGQAAVELAQHFGRVIATDPSTKQLTSAMGHPKVDYRPARAEQSGLDDLSAQLITVAQAFHWFRQEEFFQEVRRVAEPGGVLAVWCYELAVVEPEIDRVVLRLYRDILGAFWDEGRRLVEEGYRNEKLPFSELTPPVFDMRVEWDLAEFTGYLNTWSAVQKYRERLGGDALALIADELRECWGDPSTKRPVGWPLALRVFQVS
jgi:SAM-dependent methyltransferase